MKALSLVLVLLAFMTVAAGRQSAQAAGDFATRIIEHGTPIPLTVGDVVLPATLNNSQSAKALLPTSLYRGLAPVFP